MNVPYPMHFPFMITQENDEHILSPCARGRMGFNMYVFALRKEDYLIYKLFIFFAEYNNLSVSLREYLKKFAENGKVVRDEDIREFFSQLSANKKQKNGGMQYFCK